MIDTNQIQQAAQVATEVKTQLSPWIPALGIAAAMLGREIRNLNAWLFSASEYVIAHGGALMIAKKLLWNPPSALPETTNPLTDRAPSVPISTDSLTH